MIEPIEDLEGEFIRFAEEFGGYLEDFKRRLLLCAVLFIAAFMAGFFCSPILIRSLVDLLALTGVEYVVTSPFEVLSMSVNIGLFLAISSIFPLVLVEIYEFVRPALTRQEEGLVMRYTLAAVVFFLIGFAYGIAIMYYASWAVAAFNGQLGLVNLWNLGGFLSSILVTSALLGVLFQFPLIISAAIRFGLVSREFFLQKRRFVVAIVIILVALLPPTDGLSLIVMAVPLIGLYELTLALSRTPKDKRVLLDAAYS